SPSIYCGRRCWNYCPVGAVQGQHGGSGQSPTVGSLGAFGGNRPDATESATRKRRRNQFRSGIAKEFRVTARSSPYKSSAGARKENATGGASSASERRLVCCEGHGEVEQEIDHRSSKEDEHD